MLFCTLSCIKLKIIYYLCVKHIFGPVPSRRLGISLGIDLVPYKTCDLDCVYCEAGKTPQKTMERKPYVSAETIMYELNAHFINPNQNIDYFTLSGAGEPTLNLDIGIIIDAIKSDFPTYPLALITNGTFFSDPIVRAQVSKVDVILPSIDAVSLHTFQMINRPDQKLDFQKIIQGLLDLRAEYKGKIWVEVFMIPGLNDELSELQSMKNVLMKLKPDKVHLNSLDRPSSESWVQMESITRMEQICTFFDPLPCEILAKMVPTKKLARIEREEHTKEIQNHIQDLLEE